MGSLPVRRLFTSSKMLTQGNFIQKPLSNSICLARPIARWAGISQRAFSLGTADRTSENAAPGRVNQQPSFDDAVAQEKEKQQRAPWHREGSNVPPVARQRSAGAMVKGKPLSQFDFLSDSYSGKLLTTPSRLLKLIIPLTTLDNNSDRKDVEPLALVVHPSQPLSYLERLIQSELPTMKNVKGEDKIPMVHFKAEDSAQNEIRPEKTVKRKNEQGDLQEIKIEGQTEKTGKLNRAKREESEELGDGNAEVCAMVFFHGGWRFHP